MAELCLTTVTIMIFNCKKSKFIEYIRLPLHGSISTTLCSLQIATIISATANWKIAEIRSIGWGWTGVIWLYNILVYIFLDPIKFAVRYALSGRAWNLVVNQKTAFTNKNDFGREAREAAWAAEQRTLHGLQSVEAKMVSEKHTFREINTLAEEARRRAELARLRELHTLKGRVESFAKLRGLEIDALNGHYTV